MSGIRFYYWLVFAPSCGLLGWYLTDPLRAFPLFLWCCVLGLVGIKWELKKLEADRCPGDSKRN